jgi:hypothetical protein
MTTTRSIPDHPFCDAARSMAVARATVATILSVELCGEEASKCTTRGRDPASGVELANGDLGGHRGEQLRPEWCKGAQGSANFDAYWLARGPTRFTLERW